MKKILIGLVVFAVAVGGVFAQGWTFNGTVDGGLGLYFLQDQDDPIVAPLTHSQTDNSFRTTLLTRFTNDDKNVGADFQLRAEGFARFNTDLMAWFDYAYGWLSFNNSMFVIKGGRVNDTTFSALDRMFGGDNGEGLGLMLTVKPVENLYFGFGAYSNTTESRKPEDSNSDLSSAPQIGTSDQPQGNFAVSYMMPEVFKVVAGVSNRTARSKREAITSRDSGVASQTYLSFQYLGVSSLHAALTARLRNVEEFSDLGIMNFYVTLGHTGLVDGLDLRLGGSVGLNSVDNSDMHVWAMLGAYYQATDWLQPRLDAHFVMGGTAGGYNKMQTLHNTYWILTNETWNKDDMFVQLRPAFRFSVSSNASSFFELGGLINIDLGDKDKASGASWGGNHGINSAAYASVRVVF
ncbi:MAG: hypothetical protein FWD91_00375 [Treponema sp.]|nr:hypothetical protein [Treponema sp.]